MFRLIIEDMLALSSLALFMSLICVIYITVVNGG
jgi:hypothetical protein